MRQRVAARLLLASCTLALGLGLGTAIAVTGVLAIVRHNSITVTAPGQAEGDLRPGLHRLSVVRDDPGGGLPLSESRPDCTVTETGTGQPLAPSSSEAGFAAVRVERAAAHRLECRAAAPVTVDLSYAGREPEGFFGAIGRGLVVAVVLTVLAAVLAARALVTVRRIGVEGPPPG